MQPFSENICKHCKLFQKQACSIILIEAFLYSIQSLFAWPSVPPLFFCSFVILLILLMILITFGCYCLEMPTVDALRLAQLHNHIDKMNHEVTTREKVCGYPRLSPREHL